MASAAEEFPAQGLMTSESKGSYDSSNFIVKVSGEDLQAQNQEFHYQVPQPEVLNQHSQEQKSVCVRE